MKPTAPGTNDHEHNCHNTLPVAYLFLVRRMRVVVKQAGLAFVCAFVVLPIASAANQAGFSRAINVLCEQTGLRRDGQIKLLSRGEYADTRYRVEVPMLVEGARHFYFIVMDENFRISEF